jgi:hypothetical protein
MLVRTLLGGGLCLHRWGSAGGLLVTVALLLPNGPGGGVWCSSWRSRCCRHAGCSPPASCLCCRQRRGSCRQSQPRAVHAAAAAGAAPWRGAPAGRAAAIIRSASQATSLERVRRQLQAAVPVHRALRSRRSVRARWAPAARAWRCCWPGLAARQTAIRRPGGRKGLGKGQEPGGGGASAPSDRGCAGQAVLRGWAALRSHGSSATDAAPSIARARRRSSLSGACVIAATFDRPAARVHTSWPRCRAPPSLTPQQPATRAAARQPLSLECASGDDGAAGRRPGARSGLRLARQAAGGGHRAGGAGCSAGRGAVHPARRPACPRWCGRCRASARSFRSRQHLR